MARTSKHKIAGKWVADCGDPIWVTELILSENCFISDLSKNGFAVRLII